MVNLEKKSPFIKKVLTPLCDHNDFMMFIFILLYMIDVASNESQFSSSNTTLLGCEMHGSQIVPSQAVQISASGSGSQKLDLASTNMLQLPGWAKDTNLAILPDPITLNTTGI